MEILTQTEVSLRKKEIIRKIKAGALFIHPTDTIYGIGCNALDQKAVEKIRLLKNRAENPFSIWAPSLKWIEENCIVDKIAKEWLKKLPGPYTLILHLKNKKAISSVVNVGQETLGVRYPNHWFSQIVAELGLPIVTTSANKSGQTFMTSLSNLDKEIENAVDFVIFEGEKESRPSQIVNLATGEVKRR
ncbi:threonylcarbamoyl-AMP synthase [Candidatus Woesearchaeota archaeon]|nr:threonylcarbamoyl-AMP synthase [Candidatus Woesearchaeota archaeon]